MLKDTAEFIKQKQEGLLATGKGVEQALEDYQKVSEEIRKAKGRLSYKKSSRHADTYSKKVLKALKAENEFKIILMNELEDALIRSGKEFEDNKELYKSIMEPVVSDEDTYLMPVYGTGWGVKLAPQILFEHAGTLNDYSNGITAYRNQIKTKIGPAGSTRGLKATNWWYTHAYGNALYNKTIKSRIDLSGKAAPFWSLIAHGSTELASDRPDASYNPLPANGVNFIFHAEQAIERRFNELMGNEKTIWEAETREFQDDILEAENILKEMDEGIKNLTTEYQANRRILQQLGKAAKYASEERLAIAARRLRAGEEFDKGERIELTAPGMGKIQRVRPTVEQLRRLEGLDY